MSEDNLREKLGVVCTARQLIMGEAWVQKVLQLKQVSSCILHVHSRVSKAILARVQLPIHMFAYSSTRLAGKQTANGCAAICILQPHLRSQGCSDVQVTHVVNVTCVSFRCNRCRVPRFSYRSASHTSSLGVIILLVSTCQYTLGIFCRRASIGLPLYPPCMPAVLAVDAMGKGTIVV